MEAGDSCLRDLSKIRFLCSNNDREVGGLFRLYPTRDLLYVTQGNLVLVKEFSRHETLDPSIQNMIAKEESLTTVRKHIRPVLCLGILSNEDWLICSCSEEEVTLSKRDSLLKSYNSIVIGVEFGRVHACSILLLKETILVCISKPSGLAIVECVSLENPITEFGQLNLVKIEMLATCDRVNQPVNWVQLLHFHGVLHVIGISYGNAVSLKMWEVMPDKTFKLKDHRMTLENKVIASIDIENLDENGDEYGLVTVSPEGHCDFFVVTVKGFYFGNRIKLEDFTSSDLLSGCSQGGGDDSAIPATASQMQDDVRILAVRFFWPLEQYNDQRTMATLETQPSIEALEDLNGTFGSRFTLQSTVPEIPLIVMTSKGFGVVHLRSGDALLRRNWEDVFPLVDFAANAKIFTMKGQPEVTCAVQFSNVNADVNCFRLHLQRPVHSPNEDFSLITTKALVAKSVLRKKLRSPPPPPAPIRRSNRFPSLPPGKILAARIPSGSRNSDRMPKWARPKSFGNVDGKKVGGSLKGISSNQVPTTPRSVRIKPKATLNPFEEVEFEDNGGHVLTTGLSDSMSQIHTAFTNDGSIMAVGGNVPPLILFKTFPTFEAITLFKESRRITGLDFSFSGKHLMVATSDRKTEIINWKQEKSLLSLRFSSKFNEHLRSQFYYMDKFCLQPEANQIVLYAYRLQPPTSISLKAGEYSINAQKVTALAAPNQFYSSTILCGGSNKTWIAFDANTEQIIINCTHAHTKPITKIRINQNPKGSSSLCDLFLTSAPTPVDPIKLWDLRISKCVTRIGDLNSKIFEPTAAPALSPCGRYIATGFEENTVVVYDIRKIKSRVSILRTRSSVLDVSFDNNFAMLWCACRNGTISNFSTV